MTYYCDQTKYRKIYSKAYWGAFKGEVSKEILDNRNDFIKEFDIQGYYKVPKYIMYQTHLTDDTKRKYFDHVETYKTKDNRCIIVTSPYNVTEETETLLKTIDYIKYKPLYNDMATTFIYITKIGRN